jgi:hypothetical protein
MFVVGQRGDTREMYCDSIPPRIKSRSLCDTVALGWGTFLTDFFLVGTWGGGNCKKEATKVNK